VLAVLISQLAHAATGKSKGVDYERCVRAMTLDGHLNALTAGSAFITAFEPMLLDLGDYPHGAISTGTKKSQSTRMLSAKCPDCGYQVRLTKKWADKGLPICPTDGADDVVTRLIAAAMLPTGERLLADDASLS
jgi:hypothetical protein